MTLRNEHVDRLVDLMAELAGTHPIGPQKWFGDLVSRSNLPRRMTLQLSGTWTGDPYYDARQLIRWCLARGVNADDPRYTMLGSILAPLLDDVGADLAAELVALIRSYGLYRDARTTGSLDARYQVPVPISELQLELRASDRAWLGDEGEVEYQGFLRREPDYLDVGFLMRAIQRAGAVCRIERPNGQSLGTGFLVGPCQVLTNYHVLTFDPDADIQAAAAGLVVRFRCVTAAAGEEDKGAVRVLNSRHPVLGSSPLNRLDYAVLALAERTNAAEGVTPLVLGAPPIPAVGTGLHILQHPGGESMKLATSANGVARVMADRGIVHYATRAAGGSSGAPCFDDDWRLVALHHAERSRSFGSIREGVLIAAIAPEVENLIR